MTTPHVEIDVARAADLTTSNLYGFLRLRSEVLVVEPQSAYLDLDGRDLLDTTVHIWASAGDEVVGYVRLTADSSGDSRIGRLCTAHHARGRGVARKMVTRSIELANGTVVTSVQSHLAPWYETFGFAITGPMFHEVGIPHTPMRLTKS